MKTKATPTRLALGAMLTPWLATAAFLAAPVATHATLLYESDGSNAIDEIDSTGTVTRFATLPSGGNPFGLAFDSNGILYVAENFTGNIDKITPGGVVSTFVNLGSHQSIKAAAFDSSGNLYVANYGDGTPSSLGSFISKITPGGSVSTFSSLSFTEGLWGLAFDQSGNLYTSDLNTGVIYKISGDGSTVSTFATLPRGVLSAPSGLAFDSSGNLYVAHDENQDSITKITPGGVQSNFGPVAGHSQDGLAFDRNGNLYAATYDIDQILKYSPDGSSVSSFTPSGAGQPEFLAFGPVPEPGTGLLIGISCVGVATWRRRRSA